MKISKDKLLLWVIVIVACFITGFLISDNSLFLYTITLIISLGLFASIGKANLLSTISLFLLMYMYFIALGPIGYYFVNGKSKHSIEGMILITLFLFVAGYYFIPYREKTKRVSHFWELNIARAKTVERICLLILYTSILFKGVYIFRNRGYLLAGQLAEGRITAMSGNGLILRIAGMWLVSVLILFELRLKKIRISPWAYVGAVIAVIMELFMGGRTQFIMLALIMLLMVNKRKYVSMTKVMSFGLIAITFIIIYKIYRDASQYSSSFINVFFEFVLRESYTGCININYMLDAFPYKHAFFEGYGYLINFIMLRPGPDLDFTLTLKEIIGINFSGGGIAPTILGELYVNFGYVGCYFGMLIFGGVLRLLDLYSRRSDSLFLPAFLIVNACLAIRGGISNQEITLLVNILPYMLICYYSYAKKGKV